jgi:peptide chain release factor 3
VLFRSGIPSFAPEHFKRVILKNPLKAKQLQKGLTQLAEEGTVQVFKPLRGGQFILGAVGELQFEVTMARLKTEYSVDAIYEPVDYGITRWVTCSNPKILDTFKEKNMGNLALDSEGYLSYLTTSEWQLGFIMEQNPDITFLKTREFN